MSKLVFRVDDVSPNTDMADLNKTAEFLNREFGAEVWYCVNLFSKTAPLGSVYPDLPMRNKPLNYFMDVDKIWDYRFNSVRPSYIKIVSHGLIHSNHGEMSAGAQELSIVTSCRFLNTDTFVTPFTSWDENTEKICKQHGITLINGEGWKSMESEPFYSGHDKWFFHPWRINYTQIRDYINASKVHV